MKWFDWKAVLEEKILFDFLFTAEVFVKTSCAQRVPVAGDASQSESLSPEVAGRAKLLRFDLAMGLCLLRQSRLHPNLFSRASPDMMEIADELGQDEQFQQRRRNQGGAGGASPPPKI